MQQWVRCPRCGTNNAPGQRFCTACGTPLASGCPNCGTPVTPGSVFCQRCGMTFSGGQQQGGYYQPQQPGYPPQGTGYFPPQQPGYPPQQPGYPPQQPGYPPQGTGYYPPQQPGYPPQGTGYYPPQQPGYPPQQPGYPPQQPGYPPQQPGYPPQQPGYPPQQPGYPPTAMRGGYPPPAARQGGSGGGKGMLVALLVMLLAGLAGFGYWAYTQGYFKNIFKFGSDNTTTTTGKKDTVPPTFKNIKVDTPAIDGFWVRFDTDKPANGYVEYGPKGSFGSKTDPEKDSAGKLIYPITAHAVMVKNLQKNTEYQYRIIAQNVDGVAATSETNYAKTADDTVGQ